MKINIQRTAPEDFGTTENITREAFWNVYKPGCDEHFVLHNLRICDSYIGELDLIAFWKKTIVGHIISTKAKIIDAQNNEHEILCVGPLSVLPEFQQKGIGSMLLNESIRLAGEFGYAGMILFGNPDYYHRFGFKNAEQYSIKTKEDQNFEPFMALELQSKGLADIEGRFYEDSAFVADPIELSEFEKQFPYKEKLETDTQFKH